VLPVVPIILPPMYTCAPDGSDAINMLAPDAAGAAGGGGGGGGGGGAACGGGGGGGGAAGAGRDRVNDSVTVPPSNSMVFLAVSKPLMETTMVISPHESGFIVSGVVPLLLPSISTVAPLGVDLMTS